MENRTEYNSRMEALNHAGIHSLPSEWKPSDGTVWVKAIVRVLKVNGQHSYCFADNADGTGKPRVTRDFGKSVAIADVVGIYPVSYLDGSRLPDLRKQSDCVDYLVSHGEDRDEIKALLAKDVNSVLKDTKKAAQDKDRVKALIIKYAIRDNIALMNEERRIDDDFKDKFINEDKPDGKERAEKED